MKKVLFICTLILLSVIVNAQERHSNSTYHFETTKVFSVKMIQDKFDEVDLDVRKGNQPVYSFIIGVD